MRPFNFFLLTFFFFHFGFSQENSFNLQKGYVAEGYDLVSYFGQKAEKGSSKYMTEYQGSKFKFSSQQHLEQFLSDPEKYLPQYGGWCAYAMGVNGDKVKIDPGTFKIVDGKLYLFYNFFFNNTLKDWNKDEPNLKSKAETNWDGIITN